MCLAVVGNIESKRIYIHVHNYLFMGFILGDEVEIFFTMHPKLKSRPEMITY